MEGGAPSPPAGEGWSAGRNHGADGAAPSKSSAATTLLAVIALVAALRVAAGQIQHPFPILMRIEGFVGAKPEGITSLARWVVAIDGAQYTFHVTRLQPGADIAYWNILNRLEPLPVTLTLYGDPQLVQQFTRTPVGQPIALIGNFEFGPGPVTLQLTAVEPLATPSPSAPVPTTPPTPPVPEAHAR